jgi:hypothetical protein
MLKLSGSVMLSPPLISNGVDGSADSEDSLTVRVLRPLPALDEHGPAATRSAHPARR